MKVLNEGNKAPFFTLKGSADSKISLKDVKNAFVVLFFYPKDNTPGCSIEAHDFSKNLANFKKRDAVVFGISGGSQESKDKFCDKKGLKLILLADEDFSVSEKYNSYGTKKFMGMTFKGVFRKTFILDKDKKIIKIFDKVKPLGHAKEVLEVIDEYGRN